MGSLASFVRAKRKRRPTMGALDVFEQAYPIAYEIVRTAIGIGGLMMLVVLFVEAWKVG